MAKDFDTMEDSNRSSNLSIHDVINASRRTLLKGGAAASLAAIVAPLGASLTACAAMGPHRPKMGFKGVPIGMGDKLVVPEGYVATPIARWGEPIGIAGNMPAFKIDGSNSAADQAVQLGMHHDGLEYFPLDGSRRGLIALNHEYADDGLLHVGGFANMDAEKVKKSQNAHGLSVYEVELKDGTWAMVRPSRFARRFTMDTPFVVGGPAAGHAMMRTSADPAGRTVLGTLNNCASSQTPWGTYLSGEENWAFYFGAGDNPTPHQRRWGARKDGSYQWEKFDPRFDLRQNPNEFNRFGWVVEVDPMDPTSTPVKRTALGRAAHEGAWVGVTRDGRAVVYSGEDARFEYIYKFVSRDKIRPAGGGLTKAQANKDLLDHGTLFVARFDADGTGRWLPLVHGQGPLTAANGFADQGEVVIKARQASDLLGATKMDRPEWLAIDPTNGWVYCTLTNNTSRGQPNQPGVDAANPRANNTMGQIIRWKDQGDFDGVGFEWNLLALAGDPANERPEAKGNIKGDIYGCPDGLAFDQRGLLWIQTDAHATQMYKGEFKGIGNNQMLACDPATGETRRFLTGPTNCEITGITFTPDGTTVFISVQHPGETPTDRSDPKDPAKYSNWPDYTPGGRPRSSNVAIRKKDGGVIGT
ncbi:MAG: PhoX family phosphatase [Rhodoferax sp.]|nr:PhoX family phosphatase [Rhodoferax sp.]